MGAYIHKYCLMLWSGKGVAHVFAILFCYAWCLDIVEGGVGACVNLL